MELTKQYTIQLPQFEGPFDLLLFFIERDELDIYDIPISTITHDFLSYTKHLEKIDSIEEASEFMVMAATLMKIKARTLLPCPQIDEAGEVIDPRSDLVKSLIEYQKIKALAEKIEQLATIRASLFERGYAQTELTQLTQQKSLQEEWCGLTLFSLAESFRKTWQKFALQESIPQKHIVQPFPYQIETVKSSLIRRVTLTQKICFEDIIMESPNKLYAIFCFLAVLELIQEGRFGVLLGGDPNKFWLIHKEELVAA